MTRMTFVLLTLVRSGYEGEMSRSTYRHTLRLSAPLPAVDKTSDIVCRVMDASENASSRTAHAAHPCRLGSLRTRGASWGPMTAAAAGAVLPSHRPAPRWQAWRLWGRCRA